jgi:hypothetical protein
MSLEGAERPDTDIGVIFVAEPRRSDPRVTDLIDRIRKLVKGQ